MFRYVLDFSFFRLKPDVFPFFQYSHQAKLNNSFTQRLLMLIFSWDYPNMLIL